MLVRLIIVLAVFALSTFLFYKASGSLSFKKLNMTSAMYYYILAFNLIGGSLIYIGLRKHYLIQKVADASTIYTGY